MPEKKTNKPEAQEREKRIQPYTIAQIVEILNVVKASVGEVEAFLGKLGRNKFDGTLEAENGKTVRTGAEHLIKWVANLEADWKKKRLDNAFNNPNPIPPVE
jgi:hypothetical protein